MRILIFNWRDIQNPSSGGAEILTHQIARYWVKHGHKVTQFSSRFFGSKEREIIDGIEIIRKGNPDARYLLNSVQFLAFWYYQRVFKGNFDIVIDEVHGVPFFTPLYVKEKKIILICEVAGELWGEVFGLFYGFIGWAVEKFYLRFIYKNLSYLTISNSTRDDLVKNGVRDTNIRVLHMGVSVPKKLNSFKREDNPVLVFLGRCSRSKGIEDAILAFKKLQKKYVKSRLWIIGRGDANYKDELILFSKKLELQKKIFFFDFISEEKKFELLSKSWILVHPSITEGWGLNVIEANTVGTPAVGYNIGGLRDSIQHMKTGLLTEKNTPEDLFKEILRLITDKALYNKLSQNSLKWSKKFSWQKTGEESLRAIEKTYGGKN